MLVSNHYTSLVPVGIAMNRVVLVKYALVSVSILTVYMCLFLYLVLMPVCVMIGYKLPMLPGLLVPVVVRIVRLCITNKKYYYAMQ